MKDAESRKIVLVRCMIDFKDIRIWLRVFSLNLNAYGVMMKFFKILSWKNQEDRHNFVSIEIQGEYSWSNSYIFEIDNAAY